MNADAGTDSSASKDVFYEGKLLPTDSVVITDGVLREWAAHFRAHDVTQFGFYFDRQLGGKWCTWEGGKRIQLGKNSLAIPAMIKAIRKALL